MVVLQCIKNLEWIFIVSLLSSHSSCISCEEQPLPLLSANASGSFHSPGRGLAGDPCKSEQQIPLATVIVWDERVTQFNLSRLCPESNTGFESECLRTVEPYLPP